MITNYYVGKTDMLNRYNIIRFRLNNNVLLICRIGAQLTYQMGLAYRENNGYIIMWCMTLCQSRLVIVQKRSNSVEQLSVQNPLLGVGFVTSVSTRMWYNLVT